MNLGDILAEACEKDLNAFTAKAFSILEPGRPFQSNWHIDCISEHLMAVADGELQRIIINVPPRTLKSVHVAQIYPAWQLIRDPSHQFICAAYAHSLAERNVTKARQLIQSVFYQHSYDVEISKDNNRRTSSRQRETDSIRELVLGVQLQDLALIHF